MSGPKCARVVDEAALANQALRTFDNQRTKIGKVTDSQIDDLLSESNQIADASSRRLQDLTIALDRLSADDVRVAGTNLKAINQVIASANQDAAALRSSLANVSKIRTESDSVLRAAEARRAQGE